MIQLLSTEGKTVLTWAPIPRWLDATILRHDGKLYTYSGKLRGHYIFEETQPVDIP